MTNLRLDQQKSDRRVDIFVRGELDNATAEQFTATVQAACKAADLVVLDLFECSYIDSTGLNQILRACTPLEGGPRKVKIGAISDHVHRVLDRTGCADLLEFLPSTACPHCGAAMSVGLYPCPRCKGAQQDP